MSFFIARMRTHAFTLLALLLIVLSSCTRMKDFDEEINTGGPVSSVRVLTRSVQGDDLFFPLHAYAFGANGNLVAHQQLNSASDDLRLSLPQQTDCRIVILSANPEDYNIPSSPTATSLISPKSPTDIAGVSPSVAALARGYAKSPLQMGFVDVNPQNDNSTVSVQLHYQVASLSVSLSNLPSACTSAYVTVASPATSLNFEGATEGVQTARIPLSNAGNSFATPSPPVYLLPSSGSTTTFTISYNDAAGEQFASATYQAPLKAGIPYQLNGAYADGAFVLKGDITPSEWAEPVALDFAFNNGGNTTIIPEGTTPDDSSDPYPVTTIPDPLSLWNGHIVIASTAPDAYAPRVATVSEASASDSSSAASGSSSAASGSSAPASGSSSAASGSSSPASGSTATLTLLSLNDWDALTSVFNANTPDVASTIASDYTEYDLSNWRIPTEDEGRLLSQLYRDQSEIFDALLEKAKASPVVLTDGKGNNIRYLCEDATKTYSFKTSTITNAGATVKTYHLRLVRTVNVILKD